MKQTILAKVKSVTNLIVESKSAPHQNVYLYVPLDVLESLYPQVINVEVLASLFLEVCLELCY